MTIEHAQSDLAVLAKGLTNEQRWRMRVYASDERRMDAWGLSDPALVEKVGINHPIFGSHFRLTALGKRLRSHLQESSHDD